ncbi:hypothetical protein [Noviherbaspirillum humi]|uniref:hypothetical protein n=1 Tax=Noviherbaspirillum humi TaxID=1688639 RepID=UPI0011605718|nr:hypothetical protein [Noviherbaspirillum humi]
MPIYREYDNRENKELAEALFKCILDQFPLFKYELGETDQLDVCINLPVQKSLKFETSLYLDHDMLSLGIDHFRFVYFPVADEEVRKVYEVAAVGFLSGTYQITHEYRGKTKIRTVLEKQKDLPCMVSSISETSFWPPWKKTYVVWRNDLADSENDILGS